MLEEKRIPTKIILAIVGSGLMAFCGVLIETSMNVTFPTLMKQFNLPIGTVQWITTGYLLLVSLVMAASAFIQRRFHLRHIFIFAGITFLLGIFVCGLAPNFATLLIGRLIQAVATGLTIPVMFAIILQQIPASRLGVFMGIGGMIVGIAPSLGPTYGGMNTYLFSWREIFWIILPIVLIAVILGGLTIPQRFKTQKASFDYFGFILLAISFFLIAESFNRAGVYGWLNYNFWGFLLIGVLVLVWFVKHSQHSKHDLLNLAVFKSVTFNLSVITYFLFQLINIGISFLLPNYGQLVLGNNSLVAGSAILLGSLVSALVQPLSGHLLDSRGAGYPIRIGSILVIGATLLFALFGLHLTTFLIIIFYIVFGLGFGFGFGNTMTNGIQQVSQDLQQDANATFSTSQQYAGSLGTAIMATFLSQSQHSGLKLSARHLTAIGSEHDFTLLLILAIIIFCLITLNFKRQKNNATTTH
ncbi:MFS transporter [Loigolactobacillus backii]|uniref:MFS transporter n=1 Tax=Loigolactobacillus backii TaxID=375175 RepID=UPI0007F08366|nr:MFS transporter [Loigolactobacillus backii]ANK60557.1 hypothetical protein AYR52_10025 [Loigolactobacillus backii]ANK65509.1 hypothetical protein AYR54_09825 [Loigolactobacillus backii]ANK67982.1 hypothetical protein AYR55_09950 [Loigolactobacillus backii]MDA5387509.1 MFS transporter [Loigolactobacillus backii]MDA5390007.1 MFS transporter [Loigolactobacillus backii]